MATDYYGNFDPAIAGEAQDSAFKGWIEIQKFSFSATQVTTTNFGQGAGSGKVAFQNFSFTTKHSQASPLLMKNCALGTHFTTFTLNIRKAGGGQQVYSTYTLTEPYISSYYVASGEVEGDSIPNDTFTLSYQQIEHKYLAQATGGSVGGAVTATWNLQQNKAS